MTPNALPRASAANRSAMRDWQQGTSSARPKPFTAAKNMACTQGRAGRRLGGGGQVAARHSTAGWARPPARLLPFLRHPSLIHAPTHPPTPGAGRLLVPGAPPHLVQGVALRDAAGHGRPDEGPARQHANAVIPVPQNACKRGQGHACTAQEAWGWVGGAGGAGGCLKTRAVPSTVDCALRPCSRAAAAAAVKGSAPVGWRHAPDRGDDMVCTRALHSVSVPSWEGVAFRDAPTNRYTAGSTCGQRGGRAASLRCCAVLGGRRPAAAPGDRRMQARGARAAGAVSGQLLRDCSPPGQHAAAAAALLLGTPGAHAHHQAAPHTCSLAASTIMARLAITAVRARSDDESLRGSATMAPVMIEGPSCRDHEGAGPAGCAPGTRPPRRDQWCPCTPLRPRGQRARRWTPAVLPAGLPPPRSARHAVQRVVDEQQVSRSVLGAGHGAGTRGQVRSGALQRPGLAVTMLRLLRRSTRLPGRAAAPRLHARHAPAIPSTQLRGQCLRLAQHALGKLAYSSFVCLSVAGRVCSAAEGEGVPEGTLNGASVRWLFRAVVFPLSLSLCQRSPRHPTPPRCCPCLLTRLLPAAA